MVVFTSVLLWVHFLALALGTGGGIAMMQVGPRLVAAAPDQRETWWPLATVFSRIAGAGFLLALVTGPLMLWLKYGGLGAVNGWFTLKLALVAVAVVTIGLSEWGLGRFRRGDEGGGRLMMVAGPLTGVTMLVIVLASVFSFG